MSYEDIDVGPQGEELDSDTRLLGTLIHLSGFLFFLIGPLIFWLVTRENHPFLDDQGKEALNFQISILIYSIVVSITVLGLLLVPFILLFGLIFQIIASIKANSGEWYRYPLTIRLVK